MKILITGGLGQIGSAAAHRAVAQGHEVTIVDSEMEGTGANPENIKEITSKVTYVKGDIQDQDLINEMCEKTEKALRSIIGMVFPTKLQQFKKRPLSQKIFTTIASYRMVNNADQRGAMGARAVYEHPDHGLFLGAPTVILILKDKRGIGQVDLDTALCAENMVLAAHSLGLGTCPIGLITAFDDDIKEELSIAEEKEVVVGVAVGFRDQDSPINQPRSERAPLDDVVRWRG